MANFWDDDDNDDNADQGDGPAGLRKAYDKLKAEAKKQAAALEATQAENAKLKGTVRSRGVADLLQAKGVSPKVARFIPDDVDADEDSVTQWLTDNADVFNIQTPDTANPDTSDADSQDDAPPAQQQFGAEQLDALRAALEGGGQGGGSVIPAGAKTAELEGLVASAPSYKDLVDGLNKLGIETTSGYN